MESIATLLFDVDGTLLDTREFILQATEHCLSVHGFAVPDRSVIAPLVGKPFNEYYGTLTGLEDTLVLQNEHRNFQLANMHLSVPFPKTLSTLQTLQERGYKMAVVTTRSKKTSLQTLEQAGLASFFTVVISAEDAPELKPHPAPLLRALELMNESTDSATMIGDSHLDIEAGKNAGIKTVRATYGFHADHLHEPEPNFFIEDIGDLLKLF